MAGSTRTWNGSTSSDPSDPSNWTPTGVPQSGDILVFTGAGVTPQYLDNTTSKSGTFDLESNGTLQFSNDTTAASNSGLNASSVIDVTGTAAATTTLSIAGPFTNYGTIEVTGTGNSLAIAIAANGSIAGSFVNSGEILVNSGDTLSISAAGGATFSGLGTVVVAGGSALVNASLVSPGTVAGGENFTISSGGSLDLTNTGSMAQPNVTFNGAGFLKLDQPGSFNGNINGFVLGDTLDLGVLNIATVITDGNGLFTAINSTGATVFTTYSNYGALSGNLATFSPSSNGTSIVGGVQITQNGSTDTLITGLQPSVWEWTLGQSAPGDTVADWTKVSGPGNGFNSPQSGDSAINAGGTILFGTNPQLTSNTIYLGGTAGVAALSGVGDSSTTFMSPSLDQNSVLTSAEPAIGSFAGNTTAAETSLLNAGGMFINEGSIIANGPTGSSFTIAISSGTVNGTLQPGYFINFNKIEVDTGNSMTITVAGTSELVNAGDILVNGGSLLFSTATNAIAGGYAPGTGIVLIEKGGTVETNVGYASNITGSTPVYAFGDSHTGNTLKIDNIGSFGGAILGFGQNDTIDLGTLLAVGTIAYSSSTGILNLENASGTILDSLLLSSGNFQGGTVSGGVAGSFNIGTVGSDTVLTTAVQNDVYNNGTGTGTWQTGTLWSNGTPGTLDTVLIGLGARSPFTLTTGSTPVSVGALTLASDKALLRITSNTTSTAYPIRDLGGTLEVTNGQTMTASALSVAGGTTVVDPTALLDLTGHVVYGAVGANNGTINASSGNTNAVQVASGALLVNGGTLNAGTGQSGGSGGKIYVGYEGAGMPATMTVQNSGTNAGVVTDTYALVASDPTSFGALTLNGNGSSGGALWTDQIDPNDTVTTRGYMDIGYNSQVGNDTLIGGSGNNTLYGGSGNDSIYGDAGTAMLVVENGATLTEQTYARIANTVDSAGSVLVSNALWHIGTGVLGGFLNVGQIGAGALSVTQGGTVLVDNGTGSLVVGSTTLQSGTFLNNGTTITGSGINVGLSAMASGTLTVSGANSLVTDANGVNVGTAGQGLVQILNGGTIQLTGTNGINAGFAGSGSGTLLISGNGAAALLNLGATAGGLTIGKSGQGTLDVESGGTIQMNGIGGIGVGQTFGATGLVIVNGPNALINEGAASNGIGVGQAGTGTLEVMNGGTISLNGISAGSGLHIGTNGGSGTVTVSGVGALITTSGTVSVGGTGTGSLTIGSGGTVQTQSLTEAASSSIVLAGGSLVDSGVATTWGTISGSGMFTGPLTNNGSIIATGGTLDFTGGLSGTGGITIAGGATLQSDSQIGFGQSVTFATSGSPEFLILGNVLSTIGFAISNWQNGDEIVLANAGTVTGAQWLGNGTLEVTSSSRTLDFTNVSLANGTTPIFTTGTNTTGANFVELISCFAAGTRIATERGPVKVEDLKEGDLVHTVIDGRPAPIVWIGYREVNCARHPQPKTVWPMHVRANAFGPGLPERDLTLSPDHAVYVNDVLIPVKHLENGSSIVQVPVDRVTYYHVELPQHDVVLAEGLPAESYLDVGDKSNFANGGGPVALFPDFIALKWEAEGCAPLVITGPEFDTVRQMLAGWAEKAVVTTQPPKRTRQRHKRV